MLINQCWYKPTIYYWSTFIWQTIEVFREMHTQQQLMLLIHTVVWLTTYWLSCSSYSYLNASIGSYFFLWWYLLTHYSYLYMYYRCKWRQSWISTHHHGRCIVKARRDMNRTPHHSQFSWCTCTNCISHLHALSFYFLFLDSSSF